MVAVLDSPEATPNQRLEACAYLIRYGQIGQAAAHLAGLAEIPDLRPRVEALLATCRELRKLDVSRGESPRPTGSAEQISEDRGYWSVPAGSDTTIIAFTGLMKRLDISIYFMQRILEPHGFNVIYLFDWKDGYYFTGVPGLGSGVADTVGSLRRMCAELRTRRLLCFGQSSGGYAALRYGLDLRADGVLAFSPVILPVMDTESPTYQRIANALTSPPDPAALDPRPLYEARARRPYAEIVFGDRNAGDIGSARHMAGLRKMVLRPLPGVRTHGTVEATTLSGGFSPILTRFCEAVGPGRWDKRFQSARLER